MPELPEVEVTREGINATARGARLIKMPIRQRQLRWPIDDAIPGAILEQRLMSCERRGKYLLMGFSNAGTLIVHLGMSGSIRACAVDSIWQTHDHVQWQFDNGTSLRYHDPRRFGAILWHESSSGPVELHPRLVNLGIEPFDPAFSADILLERFAQKRSSIKQALLEGHAVVGVGNIYASESLFRARIHPEMPALELNRRQAQRLAQSIKETLLDALASGGSTLRDYVNASGEPGSYFSLHAAVYNREGLPCKHCKRRIKRIVQNQRATYFCPGCQRLKR
jgi:formamidopyrimidine-DNA glycosylase